MASDGNTADHSEIPPPIKFLRSIFPCGPCLKKRAEDQSSENILRPNIPLSSVMSDTTFRTRSKNKPSLVSLEHAQVLERAKIERERDSWRRISWKGPIIEIEGKDLLEEPISDSFQSKGLVSMRSQEESQETPERSHEKKAFDTKLSPVPASSSPSLSMWKDGGSVMSPSTKKAMTEDILGGSWNLQEKPISPQTPSLDISVELKPLKLDTEIPSAEATTPNLRRANTSPEMSMSIKGKSGLKNLSVLELIPDISSSIEEFELEVKSPVKLSQSQALMTKLNGSNSLPIIRSDRSLISPTHPSNPSGRSNAPLKASMISPIRSSSPLKASMISPNRSRSPLKASMISPSRSRSPLKASMISPTSSHAVKLPSPRLPESKDPYALIMKQNEMIARAELKKKKESGLLQSPPRIEIPPVNQV